MSDYTVKQGDYISSIAQKHGLFWDKVWNHPKNANLQERRKDPNVLSPGDVVFVPDKEEKEESGATEQRHRFRKKGVPAKLRLRLLDEDKPRANEAYVLEIDGQLFSGTTDKNGQIHHSIPPTARKGKLMVGQYQEEYELDLGGVDPIDETRGVQARLKNLGFDCGPVDGVMSEKTQEALKAFQAQYGLAVTGEGDQLTKDKLKQVHGC